MAAFVNNTPALISVGHEGQLHRLVPGTPYETEDAALIEKIGKVPGVLPAEAVEAAPKAATTKAATTKAKK